MNEYINYQEREQRKMERQAKEDQRERFLEPEPEIYYGCDKCHWTGSTKTVAMSGGSHGFPVCPQCKSYVQEFNL